MLVYVTMVWYDFVMFFIENFLLKGYGSYDQTVQEMFNIRNIIIFYYIDITWGTPTGDFFL